MSKLANLDRSVPLLRRVVGVAICVTALALGACDSDSDPEVQGDGGGNEGSDGGDDDGGLLTTGNDGGGEAGDGNASMTGPAEGSGGNDDDPDDGGSEGGFIMPPDGGIVGQCDPAAQDCPKGLDLCLSPSTRGPIARFFAELDEFGAEPARQIAV